MTPHSVAIEDRAADRDPEAAAPAPVGGAVGDRRHQEEQSEAMQC